MESNSTFDPEKFLHQTTTEAATRRPPLNASLEFPGTIGTPKMRQNAGKKDPTKSYTFLDLPIMVDLTSNPQENARIGQDQVPLNYSVILDINDTGLDWSPGKNAGLRILRDATGTNTPGQAFSIASLEGRQVRVKIKHEEYPLGSGELQDRVAGVAKL
jgi:hypothetical protein